MVVRKRPRHDNEATPSNKSALDSRLLLKVPGTALRRIAPSGRQYIVQQHSCYGVDISDYEDCVVRSTTTSTMLDDNESFHFVMLPAYSRSDPKACTLLSKQTDALLDHVQGEEVLNSAAAHLGARSSTVVACLAVREGKAVLCGIVAGKEISEAYRLRSAVALNDEPDNEAVETVEGELSDVCVRSTDDSDRLVGGICGVELLWVHPTYTRRGIATVLVHVLRRNLVYGGHEIPVDRVAFSQPTTDGKRFATRFCDRSDILIFF